MTENFEDIFLKESGCLWYGKIRTGVTGITALCRKLDAPEVFLFKDRPKIKAGVVDGFFVKRYNLPGFFTQLRRRFKSPRPENVLAGSLGLEKLGIATPPVRAALVCQCRWCRKEYLVTGLLDEKCRCLHRISEEECRQFLTGEFIGMVRKMHDTGMYHGDLSLRNCYISGDGKAGLIDLDGFTVSTHPVSCRKRASELGRLISSFLMYNRIMDQAVDFTEYAINIYGGGLSSGAVLKVVKRFFHKGRKYL